MSKILSVHIPSEIKNNIINGALDFWQEKVGTTTTISTAAANGYSSDMLGFSNAGATNKAYTLVRSTDVPTAAQSGFKAPYSLLVTSTAATTYATTDRSSPITYRMEGSDYAKLANRTVTFGIWVKSSLIGNLPIAFNNAAFTRSYVTTVAINAANTWEFKTITLTLEAEGVSGYAFDTSVGFVISVAPSVGTSFQTATLNAWQAGEFYAPSGALNILNTNAATLQVSLLSLVEGSLGVGPKGFQRHGKDVGQELLACQRYYEKTYAVETAPGSVTGNGSIGNIGNAVGAGSSNTFYYANSFKVVKRTQPAVTVYSTGTGAANNIRNSSVGNDVGGTIAAGSIETTGFTTIQVTTATNAVTATNATTLHFVADSRL